jgi:hypothetical protein
MSDGEWKPNVIVRVGKGSDKPLDPGHQHKADYTEPFKQILTNVTIQELKSPEQILPAYQRALLDLGGIHILSRISRVVLWKLKLYMILLVDLDLQIP